MWRSLAALTLSLLISASVACFPSAKPSPSPSPEEETALIRFVERLLTNPQASDTEKPTILIGQLPPEFDLPLPQGSDVIGSVSGTEQVMVLLDVPGGRETVFSSLAQALAQQGWRKLPSPDAFRREVAPVNTAAFCSESDKRYLHVSASQRSDSLTALRISTSPRDSCSPRQASRPPYDLLPRLIAPPGVIQGGGGGSERGPRMVSSTTYLSTALGPVEVAASYRDQLAQNGWSLVEQGTAGPSAWSTWRFTHDEGTRWGGLLLLIKIPETDTILAQLRAFAVSP